MSDGPKILIADIENAPIMADVWSLWKQNVALNQINSDWFILSYSAKWLGDDHIYSDWLPRHKADYAADPECDFQILVTLRELLNEADIVIGHNSQAFDVPKINTRMLLNDIEPPSPFQQVDTLKIAKQVFRFTSNKLQYIAQALGLGVKMDTGGHELWTACIKGDKAAWKKMVEYNEHDVVLTEQVYQALAPWSKSHPNHALYSEAEAPCCTVCGSANLRPDGFAYTNMGKFQRYQCNACGKYVRGRKNTADLSMMTTNVI